MTITVRNVGEKAGAGECRAEAMSADGEDVVGSGEPVPVKELAPNETTTIHADLRLRTEATDFALSVQCRPGGAYL